MQSPQQKPILVSACLLGLDCRYNGLCKKNSSVLNFLQEGHYTIIPICPEQLAGLPTPRPTTQFASGNGATILSGEGQLLSANRVRMNETFIKGANQVLAIARMNHCNLAIMKERSPSCGVHQISLNDQIVSGSGVTTALLKQNRISVFNEDEIESIQAQSVVEKDQQCPR